MSTTTTSYLWADVTQIVQDMTGIDSASLEPNTTFDELGFDSLTTIEIAVAAELRLGVRIPDDELSELHTLGDAVRCIAELMAGSGVEMTTAG